MPKINRKRRYKKQSDQKQEETSVNNKKPKSFPPSSPLSACKLSASTGTRKRRCQFPLDELPDLVLINIFGYLSLSDLHTKKALVCRKWSSLSKVGMLAPKTVILYESLNNRMLGGRKTLVLHNTFQLEKFNPFVAEIKMNILFLCDHPEVFSKVMDLIGDCVMLRKLAVDGPLYGDLSKFVEMLNRRKSSLKTLKMLNFPGSEPDNVETVESIFNSGVENLKINLTTDYDFLINGPTKFKKLSLIQNATNADSTSQTFAVIKRLIRASENSLNELKLKAYTDRELIWIILNCSKLESLQIELENCAPNTIGSLSSIKCRKIKVISKAEYLNSRNFNDEGFQFIRNITHLEITDIRSSLDETVSLIKDRYFSSLIELHLVNPVNAKAAMEIASQFRNLKVFIISTHFRDVANDIWLLSVTDFPFLEKLMVKSKMNWIEDVFAKIKTQTSLKNFEFSLVRNRESITLGGVTSREFILTMKRKFFIDALTPLCYRKV